MTRTVVAAAIALSTVAGLKTRPTTEGVVGRVFRPGTQSAKDLESLPFSPRRTVVYHTETLKIDGRLDEGAWKAAPWSDPFIDIEGDVKPKPRHLTRVKMLWDDEFFYVGADLEEPDLWATYRVRESIIFRENDFEVFIDPDGDTHEYYEFEMNALNTVWDLMLVKPYRDGGPALDGWDIRGLKTAVHLRGTLNRPGDEDDGWSLEIAMPWAILEEAAPGRRAPKGGEQWRVNFSRVQWALEVKDGKYVKRTDAKGKPLPENNWVWSPQGAVNMHMPERWGYVQFSSRNAGAGSDAFTEPVNQQLEWTLRRFYYRQVDFLKANGRYARTLRELATDIATPAGFQLHATDELYVMTAPGVGGTVHLRQDGRLWTIPTASRRQP